ncbi:CBASS cGAMP-activated phospholipase [Serratia fonticola]|uniref:CBASS cGAMP-activated phospholipase n=1 Tax=Serratia fonticola TaxID=47917 RepID=UPI0027EEAA0A|nr:CBASS cGAMP-activated phospholipase [Serratia fonticola]MDQ7211666.1 CBASS cGAMP-activated phospholipase [Serratia fonticola]HBE9081608.1 patatin-like phospholipase family protein [Serratia fonticola]HBE9092306.1 patatin-like phospholipase family protein [Serratia fonticola]HBE9154435.1 patatin-like phospholipase family protein [Serratia fonticola]
MTYRGSLAGCRVHISGSIPRKANQESAENIRQFVYHLSMAVIREGGMIVHGSHPSLSQTFIKVAQQQLENGGTRENVLFVRSKAYVETEAHQAEINEISLYASLHIVPVKENHYSNSVNEKLLPMREWIADISDVIVCVGGDWWEDNKSRAGVPKELNCTLVMGKPAFLACSLGGATQGYANENQSIFAQLQNGLSSEKNIQLAQEHTIPELTKQIVDQIKLLPRSRHSVTRGRNFRILALDGGGIRGTFTASVLAKWAEMLGDGGENLAKHFDLIAGTSTGAILAIGLALGIPPAQILKFYRERGPLIFPESGMFMQFLKPKHESQTLRKMLEDVFGNKILSENAQCRLVLPTVRALRGESEAITTPHSPLRTAHQTLTAVEAALASSAAPTYFDSAAVSDSTDTIIKYLDGGIWANNPVLPAISEAVRYLDVPLDRIDVLNIGTVGHEHNFSEPLGKGWLGTGKISWAIPISDLFFAAQEHAANQIAGNLLGQARMLRINQESGRPIKLDDIGSIEELATRGNAVAIDKFAEVRSRFFDGNLANDWRAAELSSYKG